MKLIVGDYEFTIPDGIKFLPIMRGLWTVYDIQLGIFHIFCHVDIDHHNPEYLKDFILSCTRQDVVLEDVEINGIRGKRYGDYSETRTWIDWYMKKGDSMVCINLQGYGMPDRQERSQFEKIINSLRYIGEKKR
jgi:hypothetical protein